MSKDVKRLYFKDLTLKEDIHGRSHSLTWSLRDGRPRITVFLENMTEETKYENMYIAPFNLVPFVSMIDNAISFYQDDSKDIGNYYEMECYYVKYNEDLKTNDRYLKTVVRFGYDYDTKGEKVPVIKTFSKDLNKSITFPIRIDEKWHRHNSDNEHSIVVKQRRKRTDAISYLTTVSTMARTYSASERLTEAHTER